MNCDVGKATKGLENEAPPQRKDCRMTCDVGEEAEGLENEL